MALKLAIEKAKQILDEEQSSPTVAYGFAPVPKEMDPALATLRVAEWCSLSLPTKRSQRPREVLADPTIVAFSSVNYDLLRAILSQVSEPERPQLLRYIGSRLTWGTACRKAYSSVFPSWKGLISELPLVVEFLTR